MRGADRSSWAVAVRRRGRRSSAAAASRTGRWRCRRAGAPERPPGSARRDSAGAGQGGRRTYRVVGPPAGRHRAGGRPGRPVPLFADPGPATGPAAGSSRPAGPRSAAPSGRGAGIRPAALGPAGVVGDGAALVNATRSWADAIVSGDTSAPEGSASGRCVPSSGPASPAEGCPRPRPANRSVATGRSAGGSFRLLVGRRRCVRRMRLRRSGLRGPATGDRSVGRTGGRRSVGPLGRPHISVRSVVRHATTVFEERLSEECARSRRRARPARA